MKTSTNNIDGMSIKKLYITPESFVWKLSAVVLLNVSNEDYGSEDGTWGDDDEAKEGIWEDADF